MLKAVWRFIIVRINWIAVFLSIVGIILNANKLTLCWPIWILSNACWLAYSLPKKDWAYVLLWIVFSVFNGYGWYKWSH